MHEFIMHILEVVQPVNRGRGVRTEWGGGMYTLHAAVTSKITSKLMFESCVWHSNRAYDYSGCVFIRDIGRRLPSELQCS